MRKAITLLQSARLLYGAINSTKIMQLVGAKEDIETLYLAMQTKSATELRDECKNIVAKGYSVRRIINQLSEIVLAENADKKKAEKKKNADEKRRACLIDLFASAERALVLFVPFIFFFLLTKKIDGRGR